MSSIFAMPSSLRRPFRARLLLWLAALLWTGTVNAGALWFADAQGIHRIDTDSNAVTQHIAQQGVVALALNQKDGSLWALTAGRLFKYDANGAAFLAIDLKTLATNFNSGRRLALDASDDSIWVAGGKNAFHLDASGHLLGSVESNAVVEDVVLAQDQSLWFLGNDILARYSPTGAPLGFANLPGDMQQANFLALDDANGALWLAGGKNVWQIAPALPVQSRLALSVAQVVNGLALDGGTGTLWVAGQSSLYGFTKDGGALATIDFGARDIRNPQVVDFDAASQGLWLGHEKGITRFNASGQFVATLPAAVKVSAISAAPSGIVPIVTLVSPTDGALTRNAFIPIRLHYDASCFGQPCNFPSSVLAAYTLTATLNGQSIGGAFVFDPSTNDAIFTPTVRLPEGVNSFSAFVTDSSGRRSQTLTSRFTVDSVAPGFVNVTPADNSVFVSPGITLQGSVDDILASVALENFAGAAVSGPNPQGQNFAWQIVLKPGANVFRLTATDPAGNSSQVSLTYIYSTLTITIASPANGATIDSDRVTVTGSFTGATTATIKVNGIAALVTGTTFSAADIPLQFGANTITVVGTTTEGAQDTRSITVTSTAPGIAITSPANGASVNADSVLVRGTIQAVAGSGVSVNGVVAAVNSANSFFAVVPLSAGVNTLTAKVTAPGGASASRSITVNATGLPPPVTATAEPTSGFAPLTVTFTVTNTTGLDATFTFDGVGPYSVPAGGTSTINVTYPEGIFTATIVVNGGAPQVFVINVTSIAAVDAMLQALWRKVVDNLAAGNIEGALAYFAPGMRVNYRAVLNDIAPALPAMFASFPPITATAMVDGDAEYFVMIPRAGKKYGYYLYFMKDGDGVWRLHSL